MKECPKCRNIFDEGMKFCQTDGTALVAVAGEQTNESDPYATMVGNQNDLPIPPDDKSADKTVADADPYATVVGGGYSLPMDEADDDDFNLLEIPGNNIDEYDPNKTMAAGGNTADNYRLNISEEDIADTPEDSGNIKKSEITSMITPQIPKFDEPEIAPPDLDEEPPLFKSDDLSFKEDATPPPGSPFASDTSRADDFAEDESMLNQSPFGGFDNFDSAVNTSPFEVPRETLKPELPNEGQKFDFSEPPPFGEFNQQNFGANDTDNWQPPAAPMQEFENKSIGQNTPFESPAGGQDQTLAYVSLGAGISAFVCLGPIGSITALITGYLAKKNIKENPDKYGGATLATVGMVLGGISLFLTAIVIIFYIIIIVAAAGS